MRYITISCELIPQDVGGYTVYCPELDIYTQGETVDECVTNLKEAAELHIEEVGMGNLKLNNIKRKKLKVAVNA